MAGKTREVALQPFGGSLVTTILLLSLLLSSVSAQVGRTTQPPLLLSTYHLHLSARAGATTTASGTVQWVSTAARVDALASSVSTANGGEWLAVSRSDTPSHRPKAVRITAAPQGLEAGEYKGTVTLSAPEQDLPAVTVDVTFLVWNNTGTQIYGLSTQEMVWGERRTLNLSGTGLTGFTSVEFEPADGLALDEFRLSSSTSASVRVKVFDSAPAGERQLVLRGPGRETNKLRFYVREQTPYIGEVSPAVLHPGRIYVWGRPPYDKEFRVAGMDLAGLEALDSAPQQNFDVTLISDPTDVGGFISVAENATPGRHELNLIMPVVASMTIPIEIQPAPPSWPEIFDLELEDAYFSSNAIVYRGKFKFRDTDGDVVRDKIAIRFIIDASGGFGSNKHYTSGGFTVTGTTEGEVSFEIRDTPFLGLYREYTGNLPIAVTLVDAAGNLSNAARVRKPRWLTSVF